MVKSTFHMVNFVLFIWSTFYFLYVQVDFFMVKSTFHIVNFLLFISVSVKCRLQTSDWR